MNDKSAPEPKALELPPLYPIVDIDTLNRTGLTLRETVRALLEGGARVLQLRHKHGSPQQVLAAAAAISEEIGTADCLPVMNDRVDFALLAGWPAVHLGHDDLSPAAARLIARQAGFRIGVSTHTDVQVASADRGSADYIAIGPVFSTVSKANAEPVVGLEGVRRARSLTRKPLVAIGGITLENAMAVREAGADSLAVIGALFAGSGDPGTGVRDFLRALR